MPNGDNGFAKVLEEWEKRAEEYIGLSVSEQEKINQLNIQLQNRQIGPVEKEFAQYDILGSFMRSITASELVPIGPKELKTVRTELDLSINNMEKYDFYYKLYYEVPYVIMGGKSVTVDDILTNLTIPAGISPDELAEVESTISNMISVITIGVEALPEMAAEAELLELPELVLPEKPPVPVGLQKITGEEILKALTAPVVPDQVLTDAEWKTLLYETGQVESEGDVVSMEEQADQIVKSWLERNNQLEAFRQGVAEMPEYKLTDLFKDMVVQPGLAAMTIAGMYFEHVSMPLAGLTYKWMIPDIEAEYQRLRVTESVWMAASHAWQEWDSNWFLKYLVMEAVVDPLTYFGWGIATKIAKPIPYLGRFVGAAERGFQQLLEMPFDAIKFGLRKLPTTVGQRALMRQHQAGQTAEKFLTRYTGKFFNQITMEDWTKASDVALKFFKRHPQSEADAAQFAREILMHKPINEATTRSWASTLGSNLTPDQITRTTIENVNNLFEDMFLRRLTPPKATASKLIGILSGESSDDMLKTAQRLLETHGSRIVREAEAFGRAKSVNKAMGALMKRNYRYHVAIEESVAYLARMEKGAYTALLQDIPMELQRVWSTYIDRLIVRPFAEAYLTFGMYGPMNVLEDYFRSALGGVFPRRMTVESWEKLSWGLTVDPELKRFGISEMLGPLAREGTEEGWNNWILQLAMLGQKKWADKLYTGLVRLPGAYGMDIRRNLMGGRYMQIMVVKGGAQVEKLAKVGPKVPKLVDRKLMKQLEAEVYKMKLTGNPDLIRGAKDVFTRKNIVRQEVRNTLMKYPDLPNSARQFILKQYNDNILFAEGARSVDRTMADAGSMVMDEFLKGPEYAAKQFDDLAKVLTELEVRNPQEMAQLLQSVNYMSQMEGATPRQVMAQATIKSRGLPLAERRAMLDKTYQDIYVFMDRAGASVDKVIDRIKVQMARNKPKTVVGYRAGEMKATTGITASEGHGLYIGKTEEFAKRWGKPSQVSYIEPSNPLIVSSEIMPALQESSIIWQAITPQDSTWIRLNKQAAQNLNIPKNQARWAELNPKFGDELSKLASQEGYDAIRVSFKAGYKYDPSLVGKGWDVLIDESLWKNIPTQIVSQDYIDANNRLLDVLVTRRTSIREFRAQNMASRSEIFAGATPADLKATGFWDDFYRQMDAEYAIFDTRMAELDRMMVQANKLVDRSQGIVRTRPPIVVKDRPLAPQDLANLMGVRGDDITRALLDVQVAQNSKPHFVEYVLGHVEPTDVGFTKEAIEGVYDQIAISLNVRPETLSWMTSKQMELEGVRRELHELWNSKLLPEEEITKIHGYIDGTADAMDDLMFTKVPARGKKPSTRVLKPEFKDYNQLRQSSMDEAHKWYYKEYPDYTHANAFDAMMKTIYPYWTYESQRWFWLPRSFIRHPGTFTELGRWNNNTDYGYVHVPGTSADINPFRGTIYGTMTTRLVRQDYPEYYDALPFAGGYVEFMDFLSRYGFYPGAHLGIPLALMGGREAQFGEVLPATYKTVLDSMIALFPDSKSMQAISTGIFGDRFRDFLTIREVDKRGGNGTLIFSKIKANQTLTDDEQAIWNDARSEVSWYSAGFEQFGMFRMRSDEQYAMYQEAGKAIEEMTGYTPDQQDWLRKHGYRLWDMVGGMSPTEQLILQELDYYRWVGSVRPLLPGRQQEILDRIELGWDDVKRYTEDIAQEKLQLQRQFLSGQIGPRDYNDNLVGMYIKQREYIDQKIEEIPLMDIDNRKEYYKEFNIPQPVLHPMRELLNLFFDIELEDMLDPETGEKVKDWDKFWSMRDAVEDAIPDNLREEWKDYLSRNSTRIEELRREVYQTYFRPYNEVWQAVLDGFNEAEQRLIKEYLYLEKTGQKLDVQDIIKSTIAESGMKLISDFRSRVSTARMALRFANPTLDAWLFFWGRTGSFQTSQAEQTYRQIAKDAGRKV